MCLLLMCFFPYNTKQIRTVYVSEYNSDREKKSNSFNDY